MNSHCTWCYKYLTILFSSWHTQYMIQLRAYNLLYILWFISKFLFDVCRFIRFSDLYHLLDYILIWCVNDEIGKKSSERKTILSSQWISLKPYQFSSIHSVALRVVWSMFLRLVLVCVHFATFAELLLVFFARCCSRVQKKK